MYPYTEKPVDFSPSHVPYFEILRCLLPRRAGCGMLDAVNERSRL